MNRVRVTRLSLLAVTGFVAILIALVYLPSLNQRSIRREYRNERFSFFALGDFGGRGIKPYSSLTQRQVADCMAKQARLHNVTIVLGLGDNFYPHGVKNVDDPRFQTTFEDVYSAPALKQAKWLMVAGNHDHEQNIMAQIEYTKKSHRWHFPYFYYTKVYRIPGTSQTIQLVMIDTKILCMKLTKKAKAKRARSKFPSKSIHREWVKKTLQKSTAEYLLVVGHNPILTAGKNGKSACLESFLKPLLNKYNVTVYISGHDHNFQHIKEDEGEVDFIVSGNSNYHDMGRPDGHISLQNSLKKFYGSTGGFTMFSASSSSLQVTHINTDGNAIYSTDITTRRRIALTTSET